LPSSPPSSSSLPVSSTCRSCSTITTPPAPRTTASRWCRSFPTGGSSSIAGTVLARNYSAFTLEITPSRVDDLEATIDGLSKLIEVLPKDRKRFRRLLEESKTFESLPIRSRLSEEEVARFAANRYRFPGVEVKARLFRHYPEGSVASHAIGYISRINKRDLEMIEEKRGRRQLQGYRPYRQVRAGAEVRVRDLHGETGYEQVEIDSGGRAVRSLSRTPRCRATT
jgi:penicillin-binding protein 2